MKVSIVSRYKNAIPYEYKNYWTNFVCVLAVQECDCTKKVAIQTDDAMLRVSIIHVTVVDCNEIKEYYIVILKYYLEKIIWQSEK